MPMLRGVVAVAAFWCVCACAAAPAALTLPEQVPELPLKEALDRLQRLTGLVPNYFDEVVAGKRSAAVGKGVAADVALCLMLKGTGLTFTTINRSAVAIHVAERETPPCEPPIYELSEIIVTPIVERPAPNPGPPIAPLTEVYDRDEQAGNGAVGPDQTFRLTPGMDWTYLSSVSGSIYTQLAIYGVLDRHGNTSGIFQDDIPLPGATSNTFARGIPYHFDVDKTTVLFGPQPVLLGANAQSGAVEYMLVQPDLRAFEGQALSKAEWTSGGGPTSEAGLAVGGPLDFGRLGFRISGWQRNEGGYVDRVDQFDPALPVIEGNSNRLTMKTGRIALRYDPISQEKRSVSLIPSLYFQSTVGHDSPAFMLWEPPSPANRTFSDPAAGKFYNGSLIRQPIADRYRLASLRAIMIDDAVLLESITGYNRRHGIMTSEDAESVRWRCMPGAPADPLCAYPAGPEDLVTTHVDLVQHSFTQQLQLTYTRKRFSWLVGAFYATTRSREVDRVFVAPDQPLPPTVQAYYDQLALLGQAVPANFDWTVPTTNVQRHLAGFMQVGYRIDRRLTMSAGVRVERQRLSADATAPSDGSIPEDLIGRMQLHVPLRREETVVAPQLMLSWQPGSREASHVQEFYLFTARGYAPGNVDAARPTCVEPPAAYSSDTLWSIETGTRQSWKNGAQLEFGLFQLQWDNGPEARRTCLFMHMPGKARSRGFRLNAQAPLGAGIEASLEVAYADARYRETLRNDGSIDYWDTGRHASDNPTGRILVSKGDALGTPPQVIAPWNIKATLEKRFSLAGGSQVRLRLEDTWHSHNPGPFYSENPQAENPGALRADPANNLLNGRVIFRHGEVDLAFFVDNVLDARPVLSRRNKGNDRNTFFYATTFRPRTAGLSLTWNFHREAADR